MTRTHQFSRVTQVLLNTCEALPFIDSNREVANCFCADTNASGYACMEQQTAVWKNKGKGGTSMKHSDSRLACWLFRTALKHSSRDLQLPGRRPVFKNHDWGHASKGLSAPGHGHTAANRNLVTPKIPCDTIYEDPAQSIVAPMQLAVKLHARRSSP
ncbi:hypothetical protein IE81DRAFT_323135 [Ceraceosorus guamensis]|uniref:Uncharacterized protein n=1 Tax=Ceraceosorus guamensis TaxID=1522189 RepID=A0A316VYP7_9BASI|nr:hypothetical protein IE81DRAFT_323135 [Ceraceosorus guamensis]PWN42787.1 hypothetical protein IE81DRAFT_323135 [Ceraceosorus guamensis]